MRGSPGAVSILLLATLVSAAAAAESWPGEPAALSDIGTGAAVIFTPDLALPGNRAFYTALGFVYLEDADWKRALETIRRHNELGECAAVEALVVETHGTNGHGLKLQESKDPDAGRSYISVGALQEQLEDASVDRAYLSACNAGRLFRPRIYRKLDLWNNDPLFLPPTLGVVDAGYGFDPAASRVKVLRRSASQLETLMHASSAELPPRIRVAVERGRGEVRFVISTMLIQLLTGDPRLELTGEGWVDRRSRHDLHPDQSEELFGKFVTWLRRFEDAARPDQLLAAK